MNTDIWRAKNVKRETGLVTVVVHSVAKQQMIPHGFAQYHLVSVIKFKGQGDVLSWRLYLIAFQQIVVGCLLVAEMWIDTRYCRCSGIHERMVMTGKTPCVELRNIELAMIHKPCDARGDNVELDC